MREAAACPVSHCLSWKEGLGWKLRVQCPFSSTRNRASVQVTVRMSNTSCSIKQIQTSQWPNTRGACLSPTPQPNAITLGRGLRDTVPHSHSGLQALPVSWLLLILSVWSFLPSARG